MGLYLEEKMSLRPIRLPQDIDIIGEVTLASFQYPDNPEWSMQAEEMAETSDMIQQIKRYWPLLSVLRRVSRRFNDMFLGYIWEEEGQVAGLIMYQRRSAVEYYINNVSVLPGYRRRGIARKLVEAVIQQIRTEGGKKILLDVIAGNLPARSLYEKLGWEHFSGTRHFSFTSAELPDPLPLPVGYQLDELPRSQWRAGYELDRRIVPTRVQAFRPVVERAYRDTFFNRFFDALMGMKIRRVLVTQEGGSSVAAGMYSYRTRSGGINHAFLRIDPAHEQIGTALLQALMHRVQSAAPGKDLEVVFPTWQSGMAEACQREGFVERYTYLTMGLELDPI